MSESFEIVGALGGDRSPEVVSQGYDSPNENPPRYFLAAALFMLTFFSTTTLERVGTYRRALI